MEHERNASLTHLRAHAFFAFTFILLSAPLYANMFPNTFPHTLDDVPRMLRVREGRFTTPLVDLLRPIPLTANNAFSSNLHAAYEAGAFYEVAHAESIIEALSSHVDDENEYVALVHARAYVRLLQNKALDAVERIESTHDRDAALSTARYNYALALALAGRYEDALTEITALTHADTTNTRYVETHARIAYHAGEDAYTRGAYTRAKAYFERAYALFPASSFLALRIAVAERMADAHALSETRKEDVIASFPSSLRETVAAYLAFIEGRANVANGNYVAAFSSFSLAAALYEGMPQEQTRVFAEWEDALYKAPITNVRDVTHALERETKQNPGATQAFARLTNHLARWNAFTNCRITNATHVAAALDASPLSPSLRALCVNPFVIDDVIARYAARITADAESPYMKARAIYTAITNEDALNIVYDDTLRRRTNGYRTARMVFYETNEEGSRYALCAEYASLIVAMARAVGIPAVYVNVTRDALRRSVIHACAALIVSNRILLVDPAYRAPHGFDILHLAWEPHDDVQALRLMLEDGGFIRNAHEHHAHALSCFDAALTLAPYSPRAYTGKGTTLAYLTRYEEAVAFYTNALTLAPYDRFASLGLIHVLDCQKRYSAALTRVKEHVRSYPNDVNAYALAGWVYIDTHAYADAERMFERVVRITPHAWQGYKGEGVALYMKGEYSNARASFHRANAHLGHGRLGRNHTHMLALIAAYQMGNTAYEDERSRVRNGIDDGEEWGAILLRHVLGDETREAVTRFVEREGDAFRKRKRMCEAYTAMGYHALLRGKRRDARTLFEHALSLDIEYYLETVLARYERSRLNKM